MLTPIVLFARRRLLLALLAAAAIGRPGIQARAEPPSRVLLDMPGILPQKPKPGLPDVKPQPLAWPRLDPGAVLCRSEADLSRLAANRAGAAGGGAADCRIIAAPTPVTIVQRKGPGHTEVQLDGGASGWTDVWLPAKPPTASGR